MTKLKYKQKFTPHELAQKTIRDIAKRRALEKEGQRQASMHSFENMRKVQKKLSHGRS